MKINFVKEMTTFEGKSLKYFDREKTFLKDVALDALLAHQQDEQMLPGEEKARRYVLASRIYANPEKIDLTVEEISSIKKLVGKLFGPLIVGQAFEILDGKEVPKMHLVTSDDQKEV